MRFHIEARSGDTLEIAIYDQIGASLLSDGITAKDVLATLRSAPRATTINLRINSIGGMLDDAKAIVSLLDERRRAGATVIAYVDGLAASSAAYLTTVADRVIMPSNAFLMIHEATGGRRGTADDLESTAAVMRRYTQQMAEAFSAASARRGVSKSTEDYLATLARGDTYLDASEAIAWGLADEETAALDIAACVVDVSNLSDAPERLRAACYARPAQRDLGDRVLDRMLARRSGAVEPAAAGLPGSLMDQVLDILQQRRSARGFA